MADFAASKVPLHFQQDELQWQPPALRKQRNWAPFTIRLPFLLSIILILQVCTIGLEFLLRKGTPFERPKSSTSIRRRQDIQTDNSGASATCVVVETVYLTFTPTNSDFTVTVTDLGPPTATTAEELLITTSSETPDDLNGDCTTTTVTLVQTIVAPLTAYGSLADVVTTSPDSVTPSTSAAAPSEYGSLTSIPTNSDDGTTYTSMAVPTAFGSLTDLSPSISPGTTYVSQATFSAFGSLTSVPTLDIDISTIPATNELPQGPSTEEYGVLTTLSSDYSSSISVKPPEAPAPNRYGSLTSELSDTAYYGFISSATPSSQPASTTYSDTLSVATKPDPSNTFNYDLSDHSTITAAYSPISTTMTTASSSTTSTRPTPDVLAGFVKHDLQVKGSFQQVWYFIAMYVPAIAAVIIKELWSMVGSSAKLIEPFYRLSRPTGASIKESLCSEYLASAMSWNSFKDVLSGNIHLLLIMLTNIAVALLAPLATESSTVIFTATGKRSDGTPFWANPAWLVSTSLVRGLQALLSLISICIALLIMSNLRRRSGLSANPSSIASMATLLNNPDTVRDIREMDPNASTDSIKENFMHKRYALADYIDENGYYRYGLLNIGGSGLPEVRRMLPQSTTSWNGSSTTRLTRSKLQKTIDVSLPMLVLGLLGVVIAYRIDMSQSGFNNFFNNARFGPRFILSTAATLITFGIQNIEQEVRTKIPHRRLAIRHANAERTILRHVNGTSLTNLGSSLRHQEWFAFITGLVAVLGNFLIIAVAGIPFSDAAILPAYYASVYVTVGVCGLMLGITVWAFRWRSYNQTMRIPEEPNDVVIRSLMSLCNGQNRLRIMFDRLEDTSDKALKRQCRNFDRRFWAGWIVDDEKRMNWCVDREADASLIG